MEGVFLRKLSKKLTPLDIRLEKFRFRLRPKRGLEGQVEESRSGIQATCECGGPRSSSSLPSSEAPEGSCIALGSQRRP